MYRYIQRSEKDSWVAVKSIEVEDKIAELQAKRVTILEVTELVEDEKDKRTYSYRGPLYFDIDCKSDLKLAIESAKSLVDKLVELGVPQQGIKIYASGAKGFHVTVDQKYFSSGRPIKGLPLVYKVMAKELYVPGIDFQVYSCGRGVSFRVPNVQRDDGRYRVPILYDELKDLTPADYQAITKKPRNVTQIDLPPMKVANLQNLFEQARREVNTTAKPIIIVSSTESLAKIKDEVPPCIQQICDYKGIRAEKNLNQVAIQLGIYIAKTGISDVVADGLLSRLADNATSSQYDTLRARYNHVRGSAAYMKHTEGYNFSCGAMRSLLERSPCEGCPIEKEPEAANSAAAALGLIERDDGMFIVTQRIDKPITNFTMIPTDHYIDIPKDGTKGRRVGTRIELYERGELITTVVFNETSWLSRSAFMKDTTEGHGVLTFFGSDNDVQAIKGLVLNKEKSMGEIYRVHTCGVHREEIGDSEIFTYVEPDMSINTNKIQGTHEFAGSLVARPYFSESNICPAGDPEADAVLFNLMDMNQPLEMALILGWFSACHLKTHIMMAFNQFPVLSIWGSAGSGKSVTIALASWLNGTDFSMRDNPVNVSNITPYAILDYCSSTTTVPRILEEYNKSKLRSSIWKHVGEVLKAAWNGETTLRGGLADKKDATRTGAKSIEIPVTSPLVVISEQEIDMPALQERSIRVNLSKDKRNGKREQLRLANRGRKKLREVGKALMAKSLQVTTKEIESLMYELEDLLPEEIEDRPRYSHQVAILGLIFLRQVIEDTLHLPQSSKKLHELINTLKDYFDHLAEDSSNVNARSEVDAVMEQMNIMAGIPHTASEDWLQKGQHYIFKPSDNQLILDVMTAHALYRMFSKQVSSSPAVIENVSNFSHLLTQEPYFVKMDNCPGMGKGKREMHYLDVIKMKEKGLDTSNFE